MLILMFILPHSYCVVNNTYEPQTTKIYKGNGESFTVDLEANGIRWYEID